MLLAKSKSKISREVCHTEDILFCRVNIIKKNKENTKIDNKYINNKYMYCLNRVVFD